MFWQKNMVKKLLCKMLVKLTSKKEAEDVDFSSFLIPRRLDTLCVT